MHAYIPYLLEDIEKSCRITDSKTYRPSIENYFDAVESFLDPSARVFSFSHHCGIYAADFPLPEQLTEQEMNILVKALVDMMISWNISVDLPKDLPSHRAYKLTVGVLNKKLAILNQGIVGVDFCTGEPQGCELEEYCPCSKGDTYNYRNDVDENEDIAL